VGRLSPLRLAISSGAVGALLLIGLSIFAFGGRKPAGGIGQSGSGSATPSPSHRDEATNVRDASSPQTTDSAVVPASLSPPPVRSSSPLAPAIAPFDATQARAHQVAWAEHLGIEVETTNSIGQTLVVIPPGRFTMGEGDKTVDVTLTKPFLLGQTEVTQGQWKQVMGTEPWKGQRFTTEGTDVAATFVSWGDATAFCVKLTERERGIGRIGREQAYRLPTEAEWEFSCRAGTKTKFSFGDDRSLLGDHAWFGGGWKDEPIRGGNTSGEMYAHAVKSKRPNPFGLYDVHGNVWEWLAAGHGEHPGALGIDQPGPSEASRRVLRGGSWDFTGSDCRSVARIENDPSYCDYHRGFRVALNVALHLPGR